LVGANAVATEKADKSTSKMNGSNMLQLIIQIDSLRRHGRPAVIAAFASMKVPDRTLSRKSRRFCFFERGMLSNSVSHTHRHVVILFPFIFSLSASIFLSAPHRPSRLQKRGLPPNNNKKKFTWVGIKYEFCL
jgi:hypothetical protein